LYDIRLSNLRNQSIHIPRNVLLLVLPQVANLTWKPWRRSCRRRSWGGSLYVWTQSWPYHLNLMKPMLPGITWDYNMNMVFSFFVKHICYKVFWYSKVLATQLSKMCEVGFGVLKLFGDFLHLTTIFEKVCLRIIVHTLRIPCAYTLSRMWWKFARAPPKHVQVPLAMSNPLLFLMGLVLNRIFVAKSFFDFSVK
jgi:hypothetical protein